MSYGIIGHGNVGSRTAGLLRALGCQVEACDPPLAERGTSGLVSMQQALDNDVVCLHVPLTRAGPCPTWHMLGAVQLAAMRPGSLLVNSARGDVIDGTALMTALRKQRLHAALDVWPNEPHLDPELVAAVTVATPHVAGYSNDGKLNGVVQVYRAFCQWLQHAPGDIPSPQPTPPMLRPQTSAEHPDPVTAAALEAACFVAQHDHALRQTMALAAEQRVAAFDALRRNYPPRRDFAAWTICLPDLESGRLCRNLGFSLVSPNGNPCD